jgi:hypothetical protein
MIIGESEFRFSFFDHFVNLAYSCFGLRL